MATSTDQIQEGCILTGSLFNEPMRVETVRSSGDGTWVVGLVGTQTERFRKVTLTAQQLEELTVHNSGFTYDGDGRLLRLGLQAYSLGIAWEFDPYFGLSISRVDPLPHQLEAVYDYLLKLARVRFLLADDAGAGKTIMAGLLIRELKLRGLAERILVVCPANLGATTLDRVHAAMLLQTSGQANALRMLIKSEQDRGPDFLRLANALSALYPKGSEEKRLLDAMLLAVPR